VLPFDPIPITGIPGFGTTTALKVCDHLKIRSQNDKALLAEAKDRVYIAGFYQSTVPVDTHGPSSTYSTGSSQVLAAQRVADGVALRNAALLPHCRGRSSLSSLRTLEGRDCLRFHSVG
jgi:leucyl-tRNA synthetase